MNRLKLRKMLETFYLEDIGDQDLSSETLFPKHVQGTMQLIAKDQGIFCGTAVVESCIEVIDPTIVCKLHEQDGARIKNQQLLVTLKGSVQSLLQMERVMLNLIQRMSGIATTTNGYVKVVEGTLTQVCDTRKTMPGLRMLDKYAVAVGGGKNHRIGLFDAVMLKDNHIAFAGSIKQAVEQVRSKIGHTVKIEVEVETEEAMQEAIAAGADIIMFDNCTPQQIREWLPQVPSSIITEASGMITKETIRSYAEAGVQMISVGALTHSVRAFDISANVSIEEKGR